MSISWPRAAQVAAMVAAAIGTLALLPSLLRTPEPPPLDPRIGLTGVGEPARADLTPGQATRRKRDESPREKRPMDKGNDRGERSPTGGDGRRPEGEEGEEGPGHPAPKDGEAPQGPPPSPSPATVPAQAPASAPTPTPAPPPATPPPSPSPAPEPAPPPPPPHQPAGITQFGP